MIRVKKKKDERKAVPRRWGKKERERERKIK